jgi:hypothetical protein
MSAMRNSCIAWCSQRGPWFYLTYSGFSEGYACDYVPVLWQGLVLLRAFKDTCDRALPGESTYLRRLLCVQSVSRSAPLSC